MAFLSKLQRFFMVSGSFYGPLSSHVGVPEGDPLAVTAMMVITWFVSARQEKLSGAPLLSFVDNWTVQHEEEETLLTALDCTDQTIRALGMVLALDKLKFYSTDPVVRKTLRARCFQRVPWEVVADFQDLGVYFCAARRQSAKGFNRRFVAAQSRFQKLQVVTWNDYRKSKSLVRTVMPAVLYGCELSHISWSNFKLLRGRCSSALWGQGSHREHYLTPLLGAADMYEPYIMVFLRRWQMVQRMLRRYPDRVYKQWNILLQSSGLQLFGPLSYFFEQVRELGWQVLQDGFVQDHTGIGWNVRTVSRKQICTYVTDSWVSMIIPSVRVDSQYEGLQPFCVARIRKHLLVQGKYNVCEANYITGALLTTAVKAKFMSPSEAACPLCGGDGGPAHILYDCGATQSVRDLLDLSYLQMAPNFIRISGLFPKVLQLDTHRTLLTAIEDTQGFPSMDDTLHIFTDGSTMYGCDHELAFSAWSVMLAVPGSRETTVIAAGHLPGVLQTNNRAEAYAVLQALLIGRDGFIYTDSQYVVDGIEKLQVNGWIEAQWSTVDNYDLWFRMYQCLSMRPSRWKVLKVRSHQTITDATTEEQAWRIVHNDAADKVAKDRNVCRDAAFLDNHAKLQAHLHHQDSSWKILSQLHHRVTAVSRNAKPKPSGSFPVQDILQLQLERLSMSGNDRWVSIPASGCLLDLHGFPFHGPFSTVMWNFFRGQRWIFDEQGCSLYEIYVAFLDSCGWVTPTNIHAVPNKDRPAHLRSYSAGACWAHECDWEDLKLQRPPLNSQLRIFLYILREVFARLGVPWVFTRRRVLHCLGYNLPVQCLDFRPLVTCDGSAICSLRKFQNGGSFSACMARAYPPSCSPCPSDIPLHPFDDTWRAYKASLRLRARHLR